MQADWVDGLPAEPPSHRPVLHPRSKGLMEDNVYCHVTSGLGAGLFAVLCGSPVDVVKSRMMGERRRCCLLRLLRLIVCLPLLLLLADCPATLHTHTHTRRGFLQARCRPPH